MEKKVFRIITEDVSYTQDLLLPSSYDSKFLNEWMDQMVLGLLENVIVNYQIVDHDFNIKNGNLELINKKYDKKTIHNIIDFIIKP
jgi:hypothetical protein